MKGGKGEEDKRGMSGRKFSMLCPLLSLSLYPVPLFHLPRLPRTFVKQTYLNDFLRNHSNLLRE